jgi:hypothetical protein
MVVGEAAGTAVAYSVKHNVTFRQMSNDPEAILWLQEQLVRQGAFLIEYDPPRMAVMDHWAYPGLVVIRKLAMASGGYTNYYRLDNEIANKWALQFRINQMMRVVSERTAYRGQLQVPAWELDLETDDITVGVIFAVVADAASLVDPGREPAGMAAPMIFECEQEAREARDYLLSRGVLDASDMVHFPDLDAIATFGQLFYTLGALFTYLMG